MNNLWRYYMDLSKNIILYADIIEVKRNGGTVIYEDGEGILVKEPVSGIILAEASSQEVAKRLLHFMPPFEILAVHCVELKEALESKGYLCEQICWQCAYLKKKAPRYTLPDGYRMGKPNIQHIPQMIAMYKHSKPELATEKQFMLALERGMKAVFKGQELCGFIGTHEEHSMGLLEVLPQHQKQGIGYALECAMIEDIIDAGGIPYGQVIKGNQRSYQLQLKLGMEFCEEMTYWFFS